MLSTNESYKHDPLWHWEGSEPNGGYVQKCIYVAKDGMGDLNCDSLRCSFCEFERNVAFTLRGLCQESNIDEQYIMIPSSIKNDFVSFNY